jgi:hypothetical protein
LLNKPRICEAIIHSINQKKKNEQRNTITKVEKCGTSRPVFPIILGEKLSLTLTIGQILVQT